MGKLTALKVRSPAVPGRYADGDGHFLDVSGKASGRWLLRLQAGGRRREIGLGSLKSVSLTDARDAAYMMRNKIAQGIDTVAERKREREAVPTFCKAADLVHEEHQKTSKNAKHPDQWIATLRTYVFPKPGDLPVDKIEGPQQNDHILDAQAIADVSEIVGVAIRKPAWIRSHNSSSTQSTRLLAKARF